jgi:signal transduction histidine kinase
VFRSSSLRLAALYTAAFALAVVALGLITLLTTRSALSQQFDARIRSEAAALTQEFKSEGLDGVLQAVRERDETPGALDYGLVGPDGSPLAGRLAHSGATVGWSTAMEPQTDGAAEPLRVLTVALPGGYHLLVGDDEARIAVLDGAVLSGFGWAFAGVVVLGVAGGYALSIGVTRRLAAISGTAEAIIDGDFSRRIAVRGSSDDLDHLAETINRMLDRISTLMESLRQVSNDVAHDLRTPLTRLRQRLEAAQAQESERGEAIEGALGDLDSILETFAALLRIAQIEGGARRAAFRATDLSQLARTVVDAFSPSAEDVRRSLRFEGEAAVVIDGDPELLTQMLVNLIENALRHTEEGASIRVGVARDPGGVRLWVTDNGPGAPEAERERLFDRFYRLERSRSEPGNGLGLALVSAVAKLHGAEVRLHDADPGLEARIGFPGA